MKQDAKSYREHEYILGFTIKSMEACTKYVRPQYETFRILVFNMFFNWILEEKLLERAFNE